MTQKNTWRRNLVAELDRRQVSIEDKRVILENADRRLKRITGNPNDALGKPDIFAIAQLQEIRENAAGGSALRFVVVAACALVGSGLISLGATDFGAGNTSLFGFPGWAVTLAGIAIFLAGLWTLPVGLFVPSDTEESTAGTAQKVRLVLIGVVLLTTVLFYLLGRYLDFSWAA